MTKAPDGPYADLLVECGQAYEKYGSINLWLVAHEFPLAGDECILQPAELVELRKAIGLHGASMRMLSEPRRIRQFGCRIVFLLHFDGREEDIAAGERLCELAAKGGAAAAVNGVLSPLPAFDPTELWCVLVHHMLRETCHAHRINSHVCYRPFPASIQLIHKLSARSMATLLPVDPAVSQPTRVATMADKVAKAGGRTVTKDDHEARKLVSQRWELFGDKYKTLSYTRCSWDNFAAWATDEFDDMPSDDPAKLERMVNTYRKTPTPRNLV